MNIIKPFVKEIINATPGKKMEYCGRVCYKSNSGPYYFSLYALKEFPSWLSG